VKVFWQFATISIIIVSSSIAKADQKTPVAIHFLEQQGVDIFESIAALTGYAATINGGAISTYLTADKKYAMIGNLIDASDEDLGAKAMKKMLNKS
jgi:thiol:disulfide interchange protein DsbG